MPGAGVVDTRADVRYVVTEHGVAYLRGKTLRQRAEALISIADPKFRDELMGLCRARVSCGAAPARWRWRRPDEDQWKARPGHGRDEFGRVQRLRPVRGGLPPEGVAPLRAAEPLRVSLRPSTLGAGCTGCGICFFACPEPGGITVLKLARRRRRSAGRRNQRLNLRTPCTLN